MASIVLRLICGLFFIPHIVGKFTEPATLNFFKAAKFNPPATWMYIAGTIETLLTIGLVFAIYTPYVAAIAAVHLFVAGAATYKVTKKWIWVIGGIEYCVFWMLQLHCARHADVAEIGDAKDRAREQSRGSEPVIKAGIVGLGWWGKTLVEVVRRTATSSASSPAPPAR